VGGWDFKTGRARTGYLLSLANSCCRSGHENAFHATLDRFGAMAGQSTSIDLPAIFGLAACARLVNKLEGDQTHEHLARAWSGIGAKLAQLSRKGSAFHRKARCGLGADCCFETGK